MSKLAEERRGHWLKVKNRKHPAYSRVQDQF
jgi:hypothetical protein